MYHRTVHIKKSIDRLYTCVVRSKKGLDESSLFSTTSSDVSSVFSFDRPSRSKEEAV